MNAYVKNSNEQIKELFKNWCGQEADECKTLPESGSNREYYRVKNNAYSAIGVYNTDKAENRAFLYITTKLKKAGVNVPGIFAKNEEKGIYLQEDLGNTNLFNIVSEGHHRHNNDYIKWYKKVIDNMPAIQFQTMKEFDISYCYPRAAFDKQSMMWDLNYFKYHFLKLAYTPFHEQELEDDFQTFVNFLSTAPSDFFLYRDFQSRNILIHNDEVYFIDYQGGRKGALQYDLASLLFDSKTTLTPEQRTELLTYYLDVFDEYSFFNKNTFIKYYPGFALIRILQAFGAYGYRGYFERKPYFLQSIPYAMTNLQWLLGHFDLSVELPHLTDTLERMAEQPALNFPETTPDKLNISINSFSYRKGIPEDFSGNGGGFVFDCRALPNPGRLEEFRNITGKDQPVIDFLKSKEEVDRFIELTQHMVYASVEDYLKRKFENLMISFGCTGGQHRSVYCAEKISEIIRTKYPGVNVILFHRELEKSKT